MAAAVVQGRLNPEPAAPIERARLHLPPKSYAAAVGEDGLDSSDNDSDFGNGSSNDHEAKVANNISRNLSKTTSPEEHGDGHIKIERKEHTASGGHVLTTVRPDDKYEDHMRLDRGRARRPKSVRGDSELVSGRTAGATWDRRIRWAPLNVPLKRRLQTSVLLLHCLLIGICFTIFFSLAAIPLTWPVLFPYTVYILLSNAASSGSLRRRSNLFRRSPMWSLFASYFPARLHRTYELQPTRKYIFGYHPHGILSHGAFVAFGTEALGFSQLFPGITNTLLTLDSNFRIPFYRDWMLALGLRSVSRNSIENLLSHGGVNGEGMGRAVTIVVGGARESLDARPGVMRLVLRRRKGFIRIAVRGGADLVPVVAFGENELYEQVEPESHPLLRRAQLIVKKVMGFTIPLFFARGIFNYDVGLMPFRRPLNIVVGKPIRVEQQNEPDQAYVEELHAKYVQELKRVWNEWRTEFAEDPSIELEIAE